MSSSSAKRRRYTNIKSLLVNDLNNINLTSADLNEDIRLANEDFGLFFKSMEDRQTELFARTIGIEEKYMYISMSKFYYYENIIEALTGNKHVSGGQSSHKEVQVDSSYIGRERRFIEDTQASLVGHVKQFRELLEEMLTGFKTFEANWTQKVNDWFTKIGEVEDKRAKMSAGLVEFSRNI